MNSLKQENSSNTLLTEANFIRRLAELESIDRDPYQAEFERKSSYEGAIKDQSASDFNAGHKNPTETEISKTEFIKSATKVWTTLRKLLQDQVSKGRCVLVPICGKFQKKQETVAFMPQLDFLSAGKFKFSENDRNVSPFGSTGGFGNF